MMVLFFHLSDIQHGPLWARVNTVACLAVTCYKILRNFLFDADGQLLFLGNTSRCDENTHDVRIQTLSPN